MKNLLFILTFLILSPTNIYAATIGDVKVLEASENIRYLSQKIAKDYLYLYKYPEKRVIKKELLSSLDKLNKDFRIIATTTKDSDTKDILEFLAYSKSQIADMLMQKTNKDNAALMLDYSETFLEGANSIEKAHLYAFSKEEKMIKISKEIKFLIERAAKYYMAINVGFDSPINNNQIDDSISKLDKNLGEIGQYSYPINMKSKAEELLALWQTDKYFFKSKELFLPNILQSSNMYLEKLISQISIFHSKNQ